MNRTTGARLSALLPPTSRVFLLADYLGRTRSRSGDRADAGVELFTVLTGKEPSQSLLKNGHREAKRLKRLSSKSLIERVASLRSVPRAIATVRALLLEARRMVHITPSEAERASSLAELITTHGPACAVRGVGSLCLAYRGNALRADARLRDARPYFRRAVQELRTERAPAWVRGEVAALHASLLKDSRQLGEAESRLEEAISAFSDAGDRQGVSRARLSMAECKSLGGEPERALGILLDELAELDHFAHSKLALTGLHNVCYQLCFCDDAELAAYLFDLLAPHYGRYGDRSALLRRRWLQGVITRGLKDVDAAESAFRDTLSSFISEGHPFLAGFVALELAALLVESGRSQEVVELTGELTRLFESQGVHREAKAAIVLFHQAAQKKRLTAALVAELRAFLERSQVDRETVFRLTQATG